MVVESAVVAGALIMLTIGGSVVTTMIPPSFQSLQNPAQVKPQHDASALAAFYNTTLTQIGRGKFENASFLLMAFPFLNISPAVYGTAQAANADLVNVDASAALATTLFNQERLDTSNNELLNATRLTDQGCVAARDANRTLVDFQGPQTSRFIAESVPTAQYSKGSGLASAEVVSLLAMCTPTNGTVPVLLIGTPKTMVETGGSLKLVGNMTVEGVGVPGQEVLFFANGSFFGKLDSGLSGSFSGNLTIPFLYNRTVSVLALTGPNGTLNLAAATSNPILLKLLFNQTSISIGDPPAVLPTYKFSVHGNLSTINGIGLPHAPVRIAFLNESQMVQTDNLGVFRTTLVVPASATDGIYNVYASFAPQGFFGPSLNFTSVQVVHLPLILSLRAPSTSLAGFSTTLVGTARANGSAVVDAAIIVNSPWGSVNTSTNSTGGFMVNLPISSLEFAFSKEVNVAGNAPQPYVASGAIVKSIGLFNILLVILPSAAVGIIGYEADRLGVFEGLRGRSKRMTVLLEEPWIMPEVALTSSKSGGGPELLQIFRQTLGLAQARLLIAFRASQTIREMIAEVQAHESGPGHEAFAAIMLTVEDFLFAESFEVSRVDAARKNLVELERQLR